MPLVFRNAPAAIIVSNFLAECDRVKVLPSCKDSGQTELAPM